VKTRKTGKENPNLRLVTLLNSAAKLIKKQIQLKRA